MGSDDYVMVPREPTEEMLRAGLVGVEEPAAPLVGMRRLSNAYRAMLSAAPPSPRSDYVMVPRQELGSIIYDIEHGFPETAIKQLELLSTAPPSPRSDDAATIANRIALLGVASCTCLTKSPDFHMHDAACRYREIMEIADAVEALSPSPPSPTHSGEVGEMVERLKKYRPKNEWGDGEQHTICDEAAVVITALAAENARLRSSPSGEVGELVDLLQKHGNINNDGDYDDLALMREAASLLLSLDAERGRMREALKPFADFLDALELLGGPSRVPPGCDFYVLESSVVGRRALNRDDFELARKLARSALPASDEKDSP